MANGSGALPATPTEGPGSAAPRGRSLGGVGRRRAYRVRKETVPFVFPPELVSQRVRLWRERNLIAATAEPPEEAVMRALRECRTAAGVEYVAVLGGSMGLVAEVVLPNASRAVVKVGPASTMQLDAVLYGAGEPILPTLIEAGSVADLVWAVVSWAGEPAQPGTLDAHAILDAAEQFAALCARLDIRGESGWAEERRERAVQRIASMSAASPPIDLKVLEALHTAVASVPLEPSPVAVHGDLHVGNFCVDDRGALRLLDAKCVAGSLCSEAGFAALMLEDGNGHRAGRPREVFDALTARGWADRSQVESWARWFAAERAISWLFNRSEPDVVLERTVALAIG